MPKRLGLYSLTFIVVSAALTAAAQNTLTNGIPSQDSLGSPTQAKTWTFSANAGDHVTLTMTKLTGGASFNPRLEVISPAGFSQGAASGNVGARFDLQAESSGTYIVLASDAFQAGTGSFQLQLAQIPEAFTVGSSDEGGGLTNGANHLGTIAAGDVDLWTTTAHAGDRITLQLSKLTGGATFSPQLEVFGPDGTRLGQNSGNLASRVDIQAAADGTYTVQVSALTPDGAGTYQLELVQSPGTLTVRSADEGGPLADGTNQSGTITVGGLDPWTFSANVGDHITLQLTKVTGGASFTPQLELIAPDGSRRSVSQGLAGATVDVAIGTSGTYVALVSDANETGTGTYTLHLARGATGPISNGLSNGAALVTSLAAGQTNSYNFLASVGDRIVLRVGKIGTTGNFNPWIRLYTVDGKTLLGSQSTATAAEIAVTATNTGTFTVTVSDGSGTHNQAGDYRLTLIKPGSPSFTGVNNGGGALTNGLAATGNINQGTMDLWTFNANLGDTIVVRMGELVAGSTLTPYLRLYGPDGVLLAQYGSSGAAAEVAFRATNSGTFSVVAGDASSFFTGTGTYRIKLVKTGSPITTDTATDEGGALTNAATQTGDIVVGDLDAWKFTAQAGQSIIVRMGELVPNSTLTPYLRLFGPDGALLSQYGSSGEAAEVAVRATNSGTFTVVASDTTAFYTGSGTYQIKLGKTGSPIVLGPNDNGGAMTNGTMLTGNVSIGGMELWNFPATAGQSLVVRMGELVANSTLTPFLRIYGPEGALLDQYGSSGVASEVAIRATNSGTFTVVAADITAFYTGSGSYRIKLAETATPIVVAPNDEGGTLTNGWNHSGNIDVGDMDVWSFQALSNETVIVRMGKLAISETLTPYLRLFGPDGSLLNQYGSSGAASEVSVRATNSGVFTVIAADITSFYTGSGAYRIKLAKTSQPLLIEGTDAGGPMTGLTNYDGSLDVGGMAVWEFTACAGQQVTLGVSELVSGSSLTPWIRLFSWDGSLLKSASGAGSAQISVVTPGSGTYTVVVADLSSFYTGSGTFGLTVNGLTTGLKICPEGADTQYSYVSLAGADPSSGFRLFTSTNVDTPFQLWEQIPASQFDLYDKINYTNPVVPAGEARRFFRWSGP